MATEAPNEVVPDVAPSIEELDRLLQKNLVRHQLASRKRLFQIDPEFLRQLVAVPGWTIPLARDFGAFGSSEAVGRVFQDAVELGVLTKFVPALDSEQTPDFVLYEMPGTVRAEVLQEFTTLDPGGERLWNTAGMIATRVVQGNGAESSMVASVVRDWARFVQHATVPGQMVAEFDAAVKESKDSAEILRLMDAARFIEVLLVTFLDNSMTFALERAARRIELLRRREHDEQHLLDFLPRKEQLDVLTDLLSDDSEHWALHLVGAGGVGKTMLLRHITSRFAKETGVAVSRVDFDYLNPDYPSLAPGLLLWAFAQELHAYDMNGQANRYFEDADRILGKLHEVLRANRQSSEQSSLENSHFQAAMSYYVDALRALPHRVLLILDTCEELGKVRPDGSVPRSVTDTFSILEMLHRSLPNLRVIFSGRRPLAREGFGWSCDAPELDRRPFLRLHEIRGFTHEEARVYLSEKAKVPADLIEAIVQRTPDVGKVISVKWATAAHAPSAVARCNPYELKLYADWAKETPPPSAATIAGASHAHYVELRILRRLRYEPFEKLLPILAVLGHFDTELLRHVAKMDEIMFEVLLTKARQQEWISIRRVTLDNGTRLIHDIEPGLRKRLLAYFQGNGTVDPALRQRAADYLVKETLTSTLETLDWSDFDATLCALEPDPPRGAAWWRDVEARVLDQRGFKWMLDLAGWLRSPEAAAGPRPEASESRLRPAVLATYAAALVNCRQQGDLARIWNEVGRKAKWHPVATESERLKLRALAGSIAVRGPRSKPEERRVQGLWQRMRTIRSEVMDAELAASLIGAVETILEWIENQKELDFGRKLLKFREKTGPELLRTKIEAAFDDVLRGADGDARDGATQLLGFATCLAARADLIGESPRDTVLAGGFRQAILLSRQSRLASRVWLDWLAPENLSLRVALEYARAAQAAGESPQRVLDVIEEAVASPNALTIDGERLLATRLCLRGCVRSATREGLEMIAVILRSASAVAPMLPVCNAHRAVPTLLATVAEALAGAGRVAEALSLLRPQISQTSGYDEQLRRDATRAYLRIVRKMRLREAGEGTVIGLPAVELPDQELAWALDGLQGKEDRSFDLHSANAEWAHAYFRTLPILEWSDDHLATFFTVSAFASDMTNVDIALDLTELNMLRSRASAPEQKLLGDRLRSSIDLENIHPALLLARSLRFEALFGDGNPERYVDRLGLRRAAQIAQEEGELMSLRRPDQATKILRHAIEWFERCDDPVGQLQAAITCGMLAGPAAIPDLRLLPILERSYGRIIEATRPDPVFLASWGEVLQAAREGFFESFPVSGEWRPMMLRLILVVSRGIEKPSDFATTATLSVATSGFSHWAAVPNVPPEYRRWMVYNRSAEPERRKLVRPKFVLTAISAIVIPSIIFLVFANEAQKFVSEFEGTSTKRIEIFAVAAIVVLLLLAVRGACARRLPLYLRASMWVVFAALSLYGGATGFVLMLLYNADGFLSTSSQQAVMGLILVLPLIYTIWILYRRLRAGSAAKQGLRIMVQPRRSDDDRVTVRLGLAPWPAYFAAADWSERSQTGFITEDVTFERRRNYAEIHQDLPPEIVAVLRRIDKVAGNVKTCVVVEAPVADLHSLPWEAILTLPVRGGARSPQELPYRIQRAISQQAALPRSSDRPAKIGIVIWSQSAIADRMLQTGWARVTDQDADFPTWFSPVGDERQDRAELVRVLHIVGVTQDDAGGLRFRIANDAPHPRQQTSRQAPDSAETLVLAESISRRFPNLDLCILQGPPLAEGTRQDSDRRVASLTRLFAARVHQHGVPCVVVIPPLDATIGATAVDELARLVKRRVCSQYMKVLDALSRIQHRIVLQQGGTRIFEAADIVDAHEFARSVATSGEEASEFIRKHLSKSANELLLSPGRVTPEYLANTLADEMERILRREDLSREPAFRGALGKRIVETKFRALAGQSAANRRLLHGAFPALIRATSGGDAAWELALDVCCFSRK